MGQIAAAQITTPQVTAGEQHIIQPALGKREGSTSAPEKSVPVQRQPEKEAPKKEDPENEPLQIRQFSQRVPFKWQKSKEQASNWAPVNKHSEKSHPRNRQEIYRTDAMVSPEKEREEKVSPSKTEGAMSQSPFD